MLSLYEQPDETFHCMVGGNIACHIIFVAESACSNSLTVWVEVILHAILFS